MAAVLRSGMVARGDRVIELEDRLAKSVGAAAGVAAASGTAALILGLRALGAGPGREVVIPSYVCRSVLDAVLATGATPKLCDIGPTWTITPESLAPAVGARTAAVVVVHTFGELADVTTIGTMGAPIVEDAAQALGARAGARQAGDSGDVAVFSFHATKCITSGEGGMLTSRTRALTDGARAARDGGDARVAAPLSDLQASLALSQLARYEEALAKRASISQRYFDELERIDARLPHELRGRSMFFRFPLRVTRDVDEVIAAFAARGVAARRGVDALLHRELGLPSDRFPETERAFRETVSIPIYPALTSADADAIIGASRAVLSRGAS